MTDDVLAPCLDALAKADNEIEQLEAIKRELRKLNGQAASLDRKIVFDTIVATPNGYELGQVVGGGTIHTAIASALRDAEHSVDPPLRWIGMSGWDNVEVPMRQWSIPNLVPAKQAGLFSGAGGTGKSILELMKDVAHVIGKDWLGHLPEYGPAFYIGAEDDEDEIHIRLSVIARHYDTTFSELTKNNLMVCCLLGKDATMVASNGKSGTLETTELYKWIYEAAGDLKPRNISIDTLSRVFSGNEIDRVQVYQYAMHMQALAAVSGGSVTTLSHPSLSGLASGSGISGSTAWHGAFRFRAYLKGVESKDEEEAESDVRELEFKKNQYGPIGEKVVLRWTNGLFLPDKSMSSIDSASAEVNAEYNFQNCIIKFNRQGRNVSVKRNSPTYAPAEFSKDPEIQKLGIRKADLEAAMNRLLTAGKIRSESYGPPHRGWTKLVLI